MNSPDWPIVKDGKATKNKTAIDAKIAFIFSQATMNQCKLTEGEESNVSKVYNVDFIYTEKRMKKQKLLFLIVIYYFVKTYCMPMN